MFCLFCFIGRDNLLEVGPELNLEEDNAVIVERPDLNLLADVASEALEGVRAVDELFDGHGPLADPEAVVRIEAEAC